MTTHRETIPMRHTPPSPQPRASRSSLARLAFALGAALVLVAPLGLGAAGCEATYQDHDLKLLTRYRAKELCSCLFVLEQPEAFCDRWTTTPPDVATYTIDRQKKEVRTQAMMYWGARARFTDPHFGCRLVD